MHFGITEKLPTDCISPYDNAGLISKVSEKIAVENAENCCSRQPHCRLTSPPRGTSANRINLTPPNTRVIGLHFAADSVIHSNFCGWLRKTHISATECVSAVQGHPRSLILAPIEMAYATSYILVINSNFGPILHRFWDTATYWLKIANFSYTTLSFNALARGELVRISGSTFLAETMESLRYRLWRFRNPSLRRFHSVPACDRRTDSQTDREIVANRGLYIASSADAL